MEKIPASAFLSLLRPFPYSQPSPLAPCSVVWSQSLHPVRMHPSPPQCPDPSSLTPLLPVVSLLSPSPPCALPSPILLPQFLTPPLILVPLPLLLPGSSHSSLLILITAIPGLQAQMCPASFAHGDLRQDDSCQNMVNIGKVPCFPS